LTNPQKSEASTKKTLARQNRRPTASFELNAFGFFHLQAYFSPVIPGGLSKKKHRLPDVAPFRQNPIAPLDAPSVPSATTVDACATEMHTQTKRKKNRQYLRSALGILAKRGGRERPSRSLPPLFALFILHFLFRPFGFSI
jgi:hypothetical protein